MKNKEQIEKLIINFWLNEILDADIIDTALREIRSNIGNGDIEKEITLLKNYKMMFKNTDNIHKYVDVLIEEIRELERKRYE